MSSAITINTGVEFYVEPGTVIYFGAGVTISLNGKLILAGNQNDSIKLYPYVGTQPWGYISSSNGEIDMNYVHAKRSSQILSANYGVVRIHNCRFDSITGGDGVAVHYADSVIIENCIFNGIKNTGKIDAIDCDGIEYGLISNNRFTNWFDDAIDIGTSAQNLTVCYNYVENCNFGLSIGEASQTTAYRNVFVKNYGGFQSHTSAVLTAYNNTLYNNQEGIEMYHGTAVGTGGIASVRNTIFSKCTAGNYLLQPSSNLTVSYCCYDTDSLIGLNNVFGDPGFTDTLLRDFHLLLGSLCINAGDPTDPLDTNGNFIDIGAYEYYGPLKTTDFDKYLYKLYPNPAEEYILIEHPDEGGYYSVYELSGKKVKEGKAGIRTTKILLSGIPAGAYIIIFADCFDQERNFLIIKE
jgi:pectate lyase